MKIVGLILLVPSIILGTVAYFYYNENYKKETAYSVVSTEIPKEEQTVDVNGKEIHNYSSYIYKLTFVTKDGKKEQMEHEQSGVNPKPLEPGAYVTAEISKKRIIEGPTVIDKAKIPKKVLEVINTLSKEE